MTRLAAAVALLLLPAALADGSLRSSNHVANLRHAAEVSSFGLFNLLFASLGCRSRQKKSFVLHGAYCKGICITITFLEF